jgi:hypothetical protein
MNTATLIAILEASANSLEPVKLHLNTGSGIVGYVDYVSDDKSHVWVDGLNLEVNFDVPVDKIDSVTIGPLAKVFA